MADLRAAVVSTSAPFNYKGIADADGLIVAQTVKTAAGNMTLLPAGTDVVLGAGKNLSAGAGAGAIDLSAATGLFNTPTGTFTHKGAVLFEAVASTASGAASFDLSGASGVFKTPTGAVTIGPGAVSLSGDTTIATGKTLSTTGTGMINLPSLFQINSVAVSANVTSANLGTLTGGGNADALHSHAASGSATSFTKTAGEAIADHALITIANDAGTPKAFLADANGAAQLPNGFAVASAAVLSGATGTYYVDGQHSIPDAQWDSVPAVADVGKPVFASVTAGKFSLTPTITAGETRVRVGWCTAGGSGTSAIVISVGEPYVN